MSARRRKTKEKQQKIQLPKAVLLVIFTIVVLCASVYLVISQSIKQKILAVASYKNGTHIVTVYDLEEGIRSKVIIPGDLYANAAHQRGEWRLDQITKIIDVEKLSPHIYADSIMKALDIPIDEYTYNSSSSMNIFERIKLALLSLNISSSSLNIYDLADTYMLQQERLPDGGEGYVMSGEVSSSIKRLFVDDEFASHNYRVEVIGGKETNYQSLLDVVDILTTIGTHVVFVKNDESIDNSDCVIESKEDVDVSRISRVFNCKKRVLTEGNLDIRVLLSKEFTDRF